MAAFRSILVLLSVFALRVWAQCQAYGVDYSNGGAYNIDASSNDYFSFISVFQGCNQDSINPVLIAPNGDQYACSAINTMPAGQQVVSTCGIPFSSMTSGTWKIVLQGTQVAVQRSIMLTVGVPQTVVVTATPTVVVGITSTPQAITVKSTLIQTQTLLLVPGTVTQNCNNGVTRTVTSYMQQPTAIVTQTLTRTQTDGQETSFWTTTMTSTAICHYPNKKRAAAELDERDAAAVAAVTVTVTETTYTVTQTQITTVPASTTTELVMEMRTLTVTPPPTTVCNGGAPVATVTVIPPNGGGAVTQTNVVYVTQHLSGTVWVGQTEYSTVTNTASASACWRAGGWYGS